MGLIAKLFGRKKDPQAEEAKRSTARSEWAMAQQSGDLERMETAVFNLQEAELRDEAVRALEHMANVFPTQSGRLLNDIGVHYYFEGEYERALTYYTRSYLAEEEGGGAAESNILEVCRKIADEANTAQDEVRSLLRYFRICTRQIDPSATIETIDLLSVFRANTHSLAEEHREAAQELLYEIEESLEDINDPPFVAAAQRDLHGIANAFGLERSAQNNKQVYG